MQLATCELSETRLVTTSLAPFGATCLNNRRHKSDRSECVKLHCWLDDRARSLAWQPATSQSIDRLDKLNKASRAHSWTGANKSTSDTSLGYGGPSGADSRSLLGGSSLVWAMRLAGCLVGLRSGGKYPSCSEVRSHSHKKVAHKNSSSHTLTGSLAYSTSVQN